MCRSHLLAAQILKLLFGTFGHRIVNLLKPTDVCLKIRGRFKRSRSFATRLLAAYLLPGKDSMRRFLLTATALSTVASAAENRKLRSTSQDKAREHVIRRVYGDDNALVRKEIRMLEERSARYQSGIRDPNHIVPYDDHPFDPDVRRRLQTTNSTGEDRFKPLRIFYETKALDDIRDSSNAAKIDWFKSEILPIAGNFWSNSLSVVPVSGNLRISSTDLDSFAYCGDSEFTQVPNEYKSTGVANTDLILFVSGSASERFCPPRTLAVAVSCNFDQFDRPTAGAVNVCLDNIVLSSDGTATPDVVGDYVDVLIHEVAHVLGHSSNSYRFFWDPDTGTPRTPRPFSASSVTCVDGSVRSLVMPASNTMEFDVDSRGGIYASIVTPKVQAIARNQFNCQSISGAQLENLPTRADSCTGDHWDERLFYPEALTAVISPTTNIL